MKSQKNNIVKTSMRMLGYFALFVGAINIVPSSTLFFHQPKCPKEFLK